MKRTKCGRCGRVTSARRHTTMACHRARYADERKRLDVAYISYTVAAQFRKAKIPVVKLQNNDDRTRCHAKRSVVEAYWMLRWHNVPSWPAVDESLDAEADGARIAAAGVLEDARHERVMTVLTGAPDVLERELAVAALGGARKRQA